MVEAIPQPETSVVPELAAHEMTLKEKRIWIIDDVFSTVLSNTKLEEYRDDDTLNGNRPIDRGTLIALLKEDSWGSESAVKELCTEIVQDSENVLAFIHPISAIEYISKYEMLPDGIIFDLEYQNLPSGVNSLDYLKQILDECLSIVQVYAKQADGEPAQLTELMSKYSTRLQPAKPKENTKASEVAGILSQRLKDSLSARISRKIRSASQSAIEKILVSMDDLPLHLIIQVIAKNNHEPMEQDLVELVSSKVSESISSSDELRNLITEYAKQRELPESAVSIFVQDVIANIESSVREHIQYEDWLYRTISSAWPAARDDYKVNDEREKLILRDFFSFRLYDHPNDGLVRTGDIVYASNNENPLSMDDELFLILTPPCDLYRFLQKTRGFLTLAKLHPLTQAKGILKIKSCGNNNLQNLVGESITAKPPVIYLPSVKFIRKGKDNKKVVEYQDYCLFAHEITNINCYNPDQPNPNYKGPLLYTPQLGYKRVCRVSEPFLSGILSKIEETVFRTGIPDMPDTEKDRLIKLDSAQNAQNAAGSRN